MNDVNTGIVKWLHSQQNWIQLTAEKILLKKPINNDIISEITEYLKSEEGTKSDSMHEFSGFLDDASEGSILHLESLGDVEGIDKLSPRNPISFGPNKLTIIYGNNGSGKSGYTRILKNVCGMSNVPALRANVFSDISLTQSCNIKFSINGEKRNLTWRPSEGPMDELKAIDVFDSDSGKKYLEGESEASYVPESVALFEGIVTVLAQVKTLLENEKSSVPLKLILIPKEFNETKIAEALQNLHVDALEETIRSYFSWGLEDEKKHDLIQERLNTENPRILSKKRRSQKQQIDSIVCELQEALLKVSDPACKEIFELHNAVIQKRKVAMEGAKATTDSSKMEGVGSTTWVALWGAANEYSRTHAYREEEFPNIKDDARCVLCHQSLEADAQKRLLAFQSYVLSRLESDAESAENHYKKAISNLPLLKSNGALETALQASGLAKDNWLLPLIKIWSSVSLKVDQLSIKHGKIVEGLDQNRDVIGNLKKVSNELEGNAVQLEQDAKEFDREAALNDLSNLKAKKWAATYADEIWAEVERLVLIKKYDGYIAKTNTRSASIKAGDISKAVITDAYVERFNTEIKALGAKHLSVELVKTRVLQGKIKHQVRLQGQAQKGAKIHDILSEGEHRIVALAAFLADVTNKNINAPFVFDDPISSLDQIHEEQTIDRLIKLSQKRQVLIFTHRLSFLGLTVERSNPHQIHIKREVWGTGEPGVIPLFAKKPVNALRDLKNNRLKKAQKVLFEDGSDEYYPLAKSICSDIRIIVERIVEFELLADVIQRHRRSVNTLGKLDKLAKITLADCNLINEIMTEYSSYEHSQPIEAPVDIPEPLQIEESIDKLLTWHDEFKSRIVV